MLGIRLTNFLGVKDEDYQYFRRFGMREIIWGLYSFVVVLEEGCSIALLVIYVHSVLPPLFPYLHVLLGTIIAPNYILLFNKTRLIRSSFSRFLPTP